LAAGVFAGVLGAAARIGAAATGAFLPSPPFWILPVAGLFFPTILATGYSPAPAAAAAAASRAFFSL